MQHANLAAVLTVLGTISGTPINHQAMLRFASSLLSCSGSTAKPHKVSHSSASQLRSTNKCCCCSFFDSATSRQIRCPKKVVPLLLLQVQR